MRTTTLTCDRCGADEGQQFHAYPSVAMTWDGITRNKDLCRSCQNELTTWMATPPIKPEESGEAE